MEEGLYPFKSQLCIAAVRCLQLRAHDVPPPHTATGCKTTYRPNYYVSNADADGAVRQYYDGVPKYLEVTLHSYVEEKLVRLFRHQMAFAQ